VEHEVQRFYLECIEAQRRDAVREENFANQLADVAEAIGAFPDGENKSDAILAMARVHRVAAIQTRARMAGLIAQYEARFGAGSIPSGSGLDPLLP